MWYLGCYTPRPQKLIVSNTIFNSKQLIDCRGVRRSRRVVGFSCRGGGKGYRGECQDHGGGRRAAVGRAAQQLLLAEAFSTDGRERWWCCSSWPPLVVVVLFLSASLGTSAGWWNRRRQDDGREALPIHSTRWSKMMVLQPELRTTGALSRRPPRRCHSWLCDIFVF